jgi:hypothetical protein
MDILKEKWIILVGPTHLLELNISTLFCRVPMLNAWRIHNDILDALKLNANPGTVVLYCCGMMAEVLIHEMYSESITQIDCGSVFDPYVGVKSRQYHHKLKV